MNGVNIGIGSMETVPWEALSELVESVLRSNPFYQRKLSSAAASELMAALKSKDLAKFRALVPLTTKAELETDQAARPPFGSKLSEPLARYTRYHQTSGTSGTPLRWLDTPASWNAMVCQWQEVFEAAGVTAEDRVMFAFSFGPFLGFWLAFETAERMGCLCIPAGGLSSRARLRLILDAGATVICCTPTYAGRLAETAAADGIGLSASRVRLLLVAGEPGGSVPEIRTRLSHSWNGARVFDHHGMTEVGPVTYECPSCPGYLHFIEDAFYAEILDPVTRRPVVSGETGELVLTTLQRTASPLLRYGTGDLVRAKVPPAALSPGAAGRADAGAARVDAPAVMGSPRCACGRAGLVLEGGILGRLDEMVIVRGVNVYPSAIEALVRRTGQIAEHQVRCTNHGSMAEIEIEIEPEPGVEGARLAARLQELLMDSLALRVPVRAVPGGSLPRFEMKAKRWIRL